MSEKIRWVNGFVESGDDYDCGYANGFGFESDCGWDFHRKSSYCMTDYGCDDGVCVDQTHRRHDRSGVLVVEVLSHQEVLSSEPEGGLSHAAEVHHEALLLDEDSRDRDSPAAEALDDADLPYSEDCVSNDDLALEKIAPDWNGDP